MIRVESNKLINNTRVVPLKINRMANNKWYVVTRTPNNYTKYLGGLVTLIDGRLVALMNGESTLQLWYETDGYELTEAKDVHIDVNASYE